MRPYIGPSAKGSRSAATITPQDLLDLAEDRLWPTYGGRDDIAVIGPALVVYFGCCGGTPTEAARATRGAFRPANSDRILLAGHKGVRPRAVPLLTFAKLKLQAYVSTTLYCSDEDSLFKDTNGNPLHASAICRLFKSLGNRIGIDGGKIPTRLRRAFLRWVDDCPTQRVRLYLSGIKFDEGISAAPSFSQTRAELESALRPLAKLDRQAIRQGGAVSRNFPAPYFPVLSREALSDLSATRKARGWLPFEALRAVQISLRSGKSPQEVSLHYGISDVTICKYMREGFPHERIPKLGQPSTRRSIIRYVHSNPGCNASQLTAWVNETFGTQASRPYVFAQARLYGLRLSPEPYRSVQREAVTLAWPTIKAEIIRDPTITNAEIAEIVEITTGVEIKPTTLFNHLRAKKDMPPRSGVRISPYRSIFSRFSLEFTKAFDAIWPTLKRELRREPTLSNRELADMFRRATGLRIRGNLLGKHLKDQSDVPFRSRLRGPQFRYREEERKKRDKERTSAARSATAGLDSSDLTLNGPKSREWQKRKAFHEVWPAIWPMLKRELLREPALSNRELANMFERETGIRIDGKFLGKHWKKLSDVPFRSRVRGSQFRQRDQEPAPTARSVPGSLGSDPKLSSDLSWDDPKWREWQKREAFDEFWPAIRKKMLADPTLSNREIAEFIKEETGLDIAAETIGRYLTSTSDVPARARYRGQQFRIADNPFAGCPREAFDTAWPIVKRELQQEPSLSGREIIEIIERETGVLMSNHTIIQYIAKKPDAPVRTKMRGPRYRVAGRLSTMSPFEALEISWPDVRQEILSDPTLSLPEIATITESKTGVPMSGQTVRRFLLTRSDVPPRSELRGAQFRPGYLPKPTPQETGFEQAWPAIRRELQRDATLTDTDLIQIVKRETGMSLSLPTISKFVKVRSDVPWRSEMRGKKPKGARARLRSLQ